MEDAAQHRQFSLGESFATVLTETTQSLVCVYDREGRILLFNDACERATGFSREEVLGRDAREFVIPPEERDAFSEFLTYVFTTGAPSPQVGHWRTKAGGRLLVAWSNKPMLDSDGAPATLVTAGIDLTDRAPLRDEDDRALQGDPGGQARGGLAARVRAAGAATRGHAGRRGGEPRTRVHGRLRGVRTGAAGQLVGGVPLRGRERDDRRAHQPRQRRRPAGRRATRGDRELGHRARAAHRRAGADRRLGRRQGRRRDRRRDLPRRLPLLGGGPDRGGGRAVGGGRDREREPAPARHGAPAGRVRRTRLAGGRERAGPRGSDRVARAAGRGGRRAAPPAGAQPPRRRPAASRVRRRQAARRPDAARDAPGDHRQAARTRRCESSGPGSTSCARSRAACIPRSSAITVCGAHSTHSRSGCR